MGRKSTNLLIALLSFLIIVLIALAFFMTWLTNEQTAFLEKHLQNTRTETSYRKENGALETASDKNNKKTETEMDTAHRFIFVGDSRTVGMEEAIHKVSSSDRCTFIGKVGEGYHWLVNDGIEQLRSVLASDPDATVIFNLGVNDLDEIALYLDFYPQIFAEQAEASFYIMSVNPVGDACAGASNEEIQNFNAKLEEAFPRQYLDCYDYLEEHGFSTVDELHYTDDTYCTIHDYVVNLLTEQ